MVSSVISCPTSFFRHRLRVCRLGLRWPHVRGCASCIQTRRIPRCSSFPVLPRFRESIQKTEIGKILESQHSRHPYLWLGFRLGRARPEVPPGVVITRTAASPTNPSTSACSSTTASTTAAAATSSKIPSSAAPVLHKSTWPGVRVATILSSTKRRSRTGAGSRSSFSIA